MSGLAAKGQAAITTSKHSFVEMAAISDMYEVQAAEIALSRSRRHDVRDLAQQMVRDHTASSAELMKTARDIAPPKELDRLHKGLIDDLKGISDEDFDKRYLSQQESAHSGAITLFRTFKDHGDDGNLREFCAATLPVLEHHMSMVKTLSAAG